MGCGPCARGTSRRSVPRPMVNMVPGQVSPAEFWGSPLCISVSPPPSPHPSLSSSCPDTRRSACLAHRNGQGGWGQGPILWGLAWLPGVHGQGGLGEQLSCPVRFIARKSQEPVRNRRSVPRPVEAPEPREAPPRSWGALASHLPRGYPASRPSSAPQHLRFPSCPKSLQEGAFLPKVASLRPPSSCQCLV